MRRRSMAAAIVGVALTLGACAGANDAATTDTATIETTRFTDARADVVRTATCECCGEHAGYLAEAGFAVDETVVELDDLRALRDELDMPADLQSCHTTLVERPHEIDTWHPGLAKRAVVEGHVPVADIDAALDGEVDGVLVPGMPPGSPGMPGETTGPLPVHHLHDGEATLVPSAGAR